MGMIGHIKNSVRIKASLAAVALLAIAVLVLNILFISQEKTLIYKNIRDRGMDFARNLAYLSEYDVLVGNKKGLSEMIAGIARHPDIAYCAVYDEEGKMLAEQGLRENIIGQFREIIDGTTDGDEDQVKIMIDSQGNRFYDVEMPIIFHTAHDTGSELAIFIDHMDKTFVEKEIGKVRLGISLSGAARLMKKAEKAVFIIGIVIALAAGAATIYFTGEVLSPIRALIEGTRNVSRGDLNYQVKVKSDDEFGELARAFNKMVSDIRETTVSINTLKESERRLANVAETSGDWIWETDYAGKITYSSSLVGKITGYTAEEAKGKYFYDFIDPVTRDESAKEIFTLMKKQAVLKNLMIKGKKKTGEEMVVEMNGLPLICAEGRLLGYVGSIRDVTERKKAEIALLDMVKAKSEFTSMVSHELRTPLTAIREGIGIVLEGMTGELNDEQKEFLSSAKRNVDRLTRLINEVLDFTKLKSAKVLMKFNPENINSVVEEAVKGQEPQATAAGLYLKMELLKENVIVRCDRDRIIQVLANLLNNAIKFTAEGGVTVYVYQRNEDIEIQVSDTGGGIKEEDKAKLFQEFKQLENVRSRKVGGTGLGLSISKEIVEQHGGRIWVASGPGKGATFHFTIPVSKERKVLVVDDDERILEMCEAILSKHGYSVIGAVTGEEGFEKTKEHRPDLVLIDLKLPDISGYEAIGRIRSERGIEHTAIIAVSGYAEAIKKLENMSAVDNRFAITRMMKPLDMEELLAVIQKKIGI